MECWLLEWASPDNKLGKSALLSLVATDNQWHQALSAEDIKTLQEFGVKLDCLRGEARTFGRGKLPSLNRTLSGHDSTLW